MLPIHSEGCLHIAQLYTNTSWNFANVLLNVATRHKFAFLSCSSGKSEHEN